MRKAFTIILAALLLLSVFVSCNQDDLVDDLFNSSVHVTFDSNGGSGSMAVQEMKGRTATALSANAFTRTGYAFSGWNTKADGSGTAYADGASVSLDSDITLYAQWIDTSSIITSSTTELTSDIGDYKLLDDVTIDSRVTVTGTVSINLAEGKTLSIPKGIRVSEGNSLTIKGKGTLRIRSTEAYNAGIGGNKDENCGTVIIEGGSIEAQCGARAAGIGGGYAETAGGNGGTITINGGVVHAMGAAGSPGIGSGEKNNSVESSVSGGNITITGGTVHVETGQYSAAIGGGDGANSGTITINGGTVRILCDLITTTIGAGRSGTNGDITISDDVNILSAGGGPDDNVLVVFKANGGEGTIVPMIMNKNTETALPANTFTRSGYAFTGWNNKADGSGTPYANEAEVTLDSDITLYAQWSEGPNLIKSTTEAITLSSGDWTIEDTTVTVTKRITVSGTVNLLLPDGKTLNASSGITVSEGNTLVIDKFDSESTGTGTLNATGEYNSAGIGGGKNQAGGNITIKGGTVTANGGYGGAGIGGGKEGSGGIITISDTADVTATGGGTGAGIGGGYRGAGGTITISGGTVNATGGSSAAGIGGGDGNYEDLSDVDGGIISISGGDITATGGSGAAGIGGGMNGNGGTLYVSDGTVVANGGENGAGIGGGVYANGGIVTIEGGTVSATGNARGAGIGGGGKINNTGSGAGANVTISGGSVTATGGQYNTSFGMGIGAGNGSSVHGDLTLPGVTLEVSTDNTSWTDYSDTRKQYMRTKTN